MALFKNNTEIKKEMFNGTVLDKIRLNGQEIYKRVLDVFKNGVLHESCSFKEYYNEATIEDGCIYNDVMQSTIGTPEHTYCCIDMDLTDYGLLTIKGQYYLFGSGSYIAYGIDNSSDVYMTMGANGTEYTIEIDVSEYTGVHYLGMRFTANGMKNNSEFVGIQNYISEITME